MAAVEEELAKRISDALAQSGERERLKQIIRARLEQSGWFEQVRREAESSVILFLLLLLL